MATITSHVLDSVKGTHAAGIRIACFRRDETGTTTLLFDKKANEQGRIQEAIDISNTGESNEIELVFAAAEYFKSLTQSDTHGQIMDTVVIRLTLNDSEGSYHVPVMLSPHSYSVWWSDSPKPA